ncbi:MAG TPA: DUF420 domain-containing protein [Rhodocyclaceae bacterium]|nr:DUF420 domain-containing protein [Rhodocyclaceae bacterium]
MDTANTLPHLNALLNALTMLLLVVAFVLIRQRRITGHRRAMIGAIAVSALFLVSYLIYHFSAPIFVFRGEGAVRPVYYALLISHVVLAAIVTPMILMTAWRGLRRLDERHRALARWTWPLWMYVSVSGVVVYALLYHVYV